MRIIHILLSVLPVIALLIFLLLTGFLGDLFWFESVGYPSVFLTMISYSAILGIIGALIFFLVSYLNITIAARSGAGIYPPDLIPLRIGMIISLIASVFAGMAVADTWEIVLKFLNQSPFSVTDPIFGMDISFYVFSLPFYTFLVRFILVLLIFTAILSTFSYLTQRFGIRIERNGSFSAREIVSLDRWREYFRPFLFQVNIILFFIFATLAFSLWLSRFNLLLAKQGAVYGAGYTEIMVTIPVMTILAGVAFFIGLCFLLNEKIRRPEMILYGIGGFLIVAVIGIVAAGVMQTFVVQPNESNLEKPYLAYNINNTLSAYGLEKTTAREFTVSYNLTAEQVAANNATISNIRLWDWRPLKTTYEQLQLFRTYYHFNDVDVDRYHLNGSYKEVLLSAREMDPKNLPVEAQTWVNQHLVYTHGYGAVMNPVDKVTSNGLPEFYMKDIPPASPYLNLSQPGIYYGEGTPDYIITNTKTDELDYPAGNQNIYTVYPGTGGIPLTLLNRVVYAITHGSIELLVSGSITPESRIHLKRNIVDRAATIAPFLSYDQDPYVVIANGQMFWIIDAYTTSDRYPYAEPVYDSSITNEPFNYVRNSVKVVINAQNGDITYYVADPTDPLITTYERIFPGLFRPMDEMQKSLREHLRYPHGFFKIQADVYAIYHMKDPRVFYNREDAWVIPDEVYQGTHQKMEPYYIIMKLPDETGEEFILMLPFTPRDKENLIGWMAARCDPEHYGELVVFQFSKQELTYGPMQIEARIDQDPEISQHITLWSQAGSSVLRGNMLIIPIEQSLLYVEPLYLEAVEKGTLPQLQRVIMAYSDNLTMQTTLPGAISEIFGAGSAETKPAEPSQEQVTIEPVMILRQIAGLYTQAETALKSGELGQYQQFIDSIGKLVSNTS